MIGSRAVSVVIPTRNRRDKLRRCITSVLSSTYPNIEVIVVDDCSYYDVSADLVEDFPQVKVVRNRERRLLSYSRNLGAGLAKGDFLFFLDDDNVVEREAIPELVKNVMKADRVAVASPVIYYYDRPHKVWTYHIQKGRLPGFYIIHSQPPKDESVTFSFHDAFLMKKDLFETLGGFDDRFFPIHFSELDLAYRMQRMGYEALVARSAKVWHDGGHRWEHVDRARAYYTLRNRIILMKRYAERKERIVYFFGILPLLLAYYLNRFVIYTSESPLATGFALVRGIVHGFAYAYGSNRRRPKVSLRKLALEPSPTTLSRMPLVSILIPTKNSERTLRECLSSIRSQSYHNIEVIVVDNSSTDSTRDIAASFEGVRVFIAGPERSAQVNYGVKVSKGDYLYRVDSDFILQPTVVDEAVRACELRGCDMIAVHNTSHPGISFWSNVRKLERDCYKDDSTNIAARFFKRSSFATVGGFDENLIASEDYDLHRRLIMKGFKLGRIKAEEMHIGEPKSLREVVHKHVFYGKKIDDFMQKYPRASLIQLGPIRLAYVRHWRDFRKDPRLLVGFVIYQAVRYSSALIGYFITKAFGPEKTHGG